MDLENEVGRTALMEVFAGILAILTLSNFLLFLALDSTPNISLLKTRFLNYYIRVYALCTSIHLYMHVCSSQRYSG